ncbi:MAG: outer membrane lipoprotein carrier protein LolA [Desulfovibrio sp.]|jgi:outer membrane lipoprotein carrier protein|nr:outer membrane lipoprotein carrier protein LolA [Desulfovibrio sp.]
MKIVSCAAILLLLSNVPAFAASRTAERLQQRYASVDSMRAEFTQTLLHKESGSRERRSGVMSFKKPMLLRWENRQPAPELLLVGKDAVWNVFPEEKTAFKYSLDAAGGASDFVRLITGRAHLNRDFDIEEEGREGESATLRLYPRKASQAVVEVLLWVDLKTFLIRKLRVYDFYGNENEMVFSRQEPGVKLPDSVFIYKPQKSFTVEDHSRNPAAVPQKPLFQ